MNNFLKAVYCWRLPCASLELMVLRNLQRFYKSLGGRILLSYKSKRSNLWNFIQDLKSQTPKHVKFNTLLWHTKNTATNINNNNHYKNGNSRILVKWTVSLQVHYQWLAETISQGSVRGRHHYLHRENLNKGC